MRYKKPPLPFNLNDVADEECVVYDDDINLNDTRSNRGLIIATKEVKNKYKKMRAKNNSLPFDLNEIEQAYTENYVNDIDVANVNLNRNAAIAAKKISEKCKKNMKKNKEKRPDRTDIRTAKKTKNK